MLMVSRAQPAGCIHSPVSRLRGSCLLSLDNSSDAEDLQYVYEWRLEQEAGLRRSKGSGMTDQEIVNFVNGCSFDLVSLVNRGTLTETDYPSYELFTERLRTGVFKGKEGSQLRLVIGKERDVKTVLQV